VVCLWKSKVGFFSMEEICKTAGWCWTHGGSSVNAGLTH
jgi:hypothetical protein